MQGHHRASVGNPAATEPVFIQELEQLARLTAFQPDLRLVVGESGSDWSFNWSSATISVDGGRLATESADFNRGLVLHESAHAAITRLQAIVPLETLRQRPIFALLNAVEDCRIETWMQDRFPGCRPWVREYNDCLFGPVLASTVQRPPAAQFLGGILTRWWFGVPSEPIGPEACQALEAVWPAFERVLKTLPPAPDSLGDQSIAYARSPVSRCYTAEDELQPPDDFEQAIRMAQYEMWSIVHAEILPVYLRLLTPEDTLSKPFTVWLSLLLDALQSRSKGEGLPSAGYRNNSVVRIGGAPCADGNLLKPTGPMPTSSPGGGSTQPSSC